MFLSHRLLPRPLASPMSFSVRWQAFGHSIQGATHRRHGLPNQDSLKLLNENGEHWPIIVAVADGHGSSKCPRSHIGSEFAVKAAVDVLSAALSRGTAPDCRRIASELIKEWRNAVTEHLAEHPPDGVSGDCSILSGPSLPVMVENSFLAYGTTIVVVGATEEGMLFLQIGDGDILTVSGNGDVIRPLPPDRRLFANETTSLCSGTAAVDCRAVWIPDGEERPRLVMLATDGYPNSFPHDAGFLKAASDLHMLLVEEGRVTVERELERWLDETSIEGSGDDITLTLLYSEAPRERNPT